MAHSSHLFGLISANYFSILLLYENNFFKGPQRNGIRQSQNSSSLNIGASGPWRSAMPIEYHSGSALAV
jgi:hypothetical protein